MILRFKTPFRFLIYSNSGNYLIYLIKKYEIYFNFKLLGGGKSTLAAKIVKNRNECMINPPKTILYFSKFSSSVPKSIQHIVEFRDGLPSETDLEDESDSGKLFILDDLQHILFDSPVVALLFQQSRHKNISIILLSQNLFPKGKIQRDITLNCTGIFLLRTCRDLSSIKVLSYQLSPLNPTKLSQIYQEFINSGYKYVFVNLNVDSDEYLRYTSDFFGNPDCCEVFIDQDQLNTLERYETSETRGSAHKIPIFKLSVSNF